MHRIVFWDFDGTLVPFDSEQYLLRSLFLSGPSRCSPRAWAARLFIYGDRRGWHAGLLKTLYAWCLRGTPASALDEIGPALAAHIAPSDRVALRALASRGLRMVLLSCGTADLSRRTLHAAGLCCFERIEANALRIRDGVITGIARRIVHPEAKVEIAAGYGVPWQQVAVVGDGLTDVPLLDRADLAVLVAQGARAQRFAGRGYQIVPALVDAIALVATDVRPTRL